MIYFPLLLCKIIPSIKKVFMDHRSEYLIEDSVNYYFEKLDEIGKPGWIPSDEDLLRTRIKTTGLGTLIDVLVCG